MGARFALVSAARGGFTLVDALVCLAALLLLLAVVLPAQHRLGESGQAASCLHRMKQLSAATQMYQADHDYLPRPAKGNHGGLSDAQKEAGLWYNALDAYLPELVAGEDHSVEQVKQDPVHADFPAEVQGSHRTIKMNTYLHDDDAGAFFFRTGAFAEPGWSVLYVDGRAHDILPSDVFNARRFDASEGTVGLRHEDGANVAFLDGHAELVHQPVRDLAAPAWHRHGSDEQQLIWKPAAE